MALFDFIGIWIGALLTLLVLSYLIHDNLLFRIAQALFVGVAIGYGATLIVHQVLIQRLFQPLSNGGTEAMLFLIAVVFLFVPMLMKFRSGGELWSAVSNLPLGYLFGVGAALALGGALIGTLAPQFTATIISLPPGSRSVPDWVNNSLLVFGTLGALLSFRFTTGWTSGAWRGLNTLGRLWGTAGRWFVMIALGALFAGAVTARVSVLVSQVYFLLHDWLGVVK